MPTARPLTELITDRFIGHQVNLLRLDAGERRRVLKMMARLLRELEAQLGASDIDERSQFQQQRLKALFITVNATMEQYYSKIAETHDEQMVELAGIESQHTIKAMNATIGVPLLTVGVPRAVLRALANDAIVQGLPAKDWWSRQKSNLRARFQNTIRQGVFAGETLGQLLRRVRGTRERQFKDGIFRMSSREAEALIRTSVQSVANAARHETLKANDEVIEGETWLSVLDFRTSTRCQALSGSSWDFEGRPIGKTKLPFPGPPPIHFACRSGLIGLVKSWEQLAKEAGGNVDLARKMDRLEKEMGPGTQSSMGGPVDADMTYEDWLRRQPEEDQIEVLGRGKWELWQAGKIELSDLIDQTGRPMTLKELRETFE